MSKEPHDLEHLRRDAEAQILRRLIDMEPGPTEYVRDLAEAVALLRTGTRPRPGKVRGSGRPPGWEW